MAELCPHCNKLLPCGNTVHFVTEMSSRANVLDYITSGQQCENILLSGNLKNILTGSFLSECRLETALYLDSLLMSVF